VLVLGLEFQWVAEVWWLRTFEFEFTFTIHVHVYVQAHCSLLTLQSEAQAVAVEDLPLMLGIFIPDDRHAPLPPANWMQCSWWDPSRTVVYSR